MLPSYKDILSRINTPPKWWDEHGVPRYEEFVPTAVDIYANEVALIRINCQGCKHEFVVAISSQGDWALEEDSQSIKDRIKNGTLHYGDPPNNGCCAAGPSMNSIPERVLQYWYAPSYADFVVEAVHASTFEHWVRNTSVEISLDSSLSFIGKEEKIR